jgi:TPP-dependent 2-oxoacid decarboxylase
MQYGSIGWSVGATLGYAQAATNKRVIACIGDGSFQVSNVIRKETFVFRTLMLSFISK